MEFYCIFRGQQELDDELNAQRTTWQAKHGKGHHKSKADMAKIRAAVLRRSRGVREACVVPEKLLYRLDVMFNSNISSIFMLIVYCRLDQKVQCLLLSLKVVIF